VLGDEVLGHDSSSLSHTIYGYRKTSLAHKLCIDLSSIKMCLEKKG